METSSTPESHDLRRALAICGLGLIALAAIQSAALYFMGRLPWCAGGRAFLYAGDIWSEHNSQHLLDPYSVSHLAHGLLLYAALALLPGCRQCRAPARFLAGALIETLWELAENSTFVIERYREATVSLAYHGDTIANSLGDLGCFAFGFLLAARWGWRGSLGFFAALEVALLFWIRDNILLNGLMLIWPIEAIRQWQMAGAPG